MSFSFVWFCTYVLFFNLFFTFYDSVYVSLGDFACLVLLVPFVCGFYLFFFFFFPFLLSHVAGRVLVLGLHVRPMPPRWDSQVQDVGSPETSWLHKILIGESSPRDLSLSTKIQLHPMASNHQCWTL